MNFAKIYSDATGRNDISPDGNLVGYNSSSEKESPDEMKERLNENAARQQAKHQWLQSSISQEFLLYLKEEKNKLLEEVMANANSFAVSGNHQPVINKAVKASQLTEIIQHLQNL